MGTWLGMLSGTPVRDVGMPLAWGHAQGHPQGRCPLPWQGFGAALGLGTHLGRSLGHCSVLWQTHGSILGLGDTLGDTVPCPSGDIGLPLAWGHDWDTVGDTVPCPDRELGVLLAWGRTWRHCPLLWCDVGSPELGEVPGTLSPSLGVPLIWGHALGCGLG